MANDARGVRERAGSCRKICAWAASAFLLTFLWLAIFLSVVPGLGALPVPAAPGWPSVSC